jgi:hypothetical protein
LTQLFVNAETSAKIPGDNVHDALVRQRLDVLRIK